MHHGFLDTSIPIDENTRILAIERPGIIKTIDYKDSKKKCNIWNTGLIEVLNEKNEQIRVSRVSSKAKLLKILKYIDNELSKKVQKTVE